MGLVFLIAGTGDPDKSCLFSTGSHNTGTLSMPSSPRRQRVPRCRSQPCVLLDRKCLKRRRDENRPKLDFLKMKEVSLYVIFFVLSPRFVDRLHYRGFSVISDCVFVSVHQSIYQGRVSPHHWKMTSNQCCDGNYNVDSPPPPSRHCESTLHL